MPKEETVKFASDPENRRRLKLLAENAPKSAARIATAFLALVPEEKGEDIQGEKSPTGGMKKEEVGKDEAASEGRAFKEPAG